MNASCADCQTVFASKKDLFASSHSAEHVKALKFQANEEFRLARIEGEKAFPDSSFMNYAPAKKAWAKLLRIEKLQVTKGNHID